MDTTRGTSHQESLSSVGRRLRVATFAAASLAAALVYGAARFNGRYMDAQVLMESMTQLHGASAHFPIGLLISSAFFELFGVLLKRDDLRATAFWTHLLGTLGAVETVVIGFLGNPYADDTGEMAIKVLVHQRVGVAAVVVFGLLAVWRVLRRNQFSRGEAIIHAFATLIGVGVVSVTGYLGGHMMD